MEAIGLYLLKSAAWLTGFGLVYLLMLRNERYFRLNRIFLLVGIVASLLFPFYTFHYTVVIPSPSTETASVGDLIVGGIVADEPAIPFYYWIYLAGMVVFLLRVTFQTWKIIRKLKKAGYEQAGAVKLVRTADYASSFSFFSYVFVNPSTSAHEMQEIMNHEREHIRQRHWLDLLLVELVCMVQWFNPFAWIYAHLVRQNHEYLADERALASTADPVIYQAALLNQLLGAPVFSLTNSFSYSLNKQRFKMMKKKINSPFRKLKMLVVLPLAAMLFYAFAVPEYQYGNENSMATPQGKTVDVKGQVLNNEGNPLSGTSVILQGSTTGTVTDKDGNFLLKGVPADGKLVFSFVGYQSKVQKVTSQPMKIVLDASKVSLDQVTINGNGTPPPPLPPVSVKGIDDANPPLIFLDGFPISKLDMDKINPETILSINVIKDKTAVEKYGEKAKNGVILITSKESAKLKMYVVDGVPVEPGKMIVTDIKNYVLVNMLNGESASKLYGEMGKNGAFILTSNDKFMASQLIFLDGKAISKSEMDQLGPDQIESIDIEGGKPAIEKYGEKANHGVILIKSKANKGISSNLNINSDKRVNIKKDETLDLTDKFNGPNPPLIWLDGKVITKNDMNQVKPDQIESISVLKDKTALSIYGDKGKNGVIVITTKEKAANDAKDGLPGSKEKVVIPKDDPIFTVVEQMPEFPGGEKALKDFISSNIKYPDYAIKLNIQGKVFVTFVVTSAGEVTNAKVVRGVNPLLDEEALRVINLLPTWKPGKQRGVEVNVSYTIPVEFKLDGDKIAKVALPSSPTVPKQGPDGVYVVVEEMPEFPGGEMALRDFIVHNIKYPATALKDSIQGKVFITFVVKADGTVGNAKIARGVSISLDNEAIRVVNSLPAWKPGKVKGQAVPVSYTVPVKFALDGNKAGFKTVSDQAAAPPKQVDGVFVVVEQMPEFVGGQDELIKFLVKEIKYPENAKKNKITGKVFVSFVVSSNGKVEQAKIVKAVDPELDAEALRVINLMPHWKPGTQHGKAVSVAYTMPIMFALN